MFSSTMARGALSVKKDLLALYMTNVGSDEQVFSWDTIGMSFIISNSVTSIACNARQLVRNNGELLGTYICLNIYISRFRSSNDDAK